MRITIDPTVANDPNAHQWLDRILYTIDDGWHVWEVAEPELELLRNTTWIRDRATQGDWVHALLVASTQRAAWTLAPHERTVRVTTNPTSSDELTPRDALRLAAEPLCILVENRFSDGAFIERIVHELDPSLYRLCGYPNDPVRIDSVGGKGQMALEVDRRTHGKPYRPRLVSVIDSDRRTPNARPSPAARRLQRICQRYNLPCWTLAKREAENYLTRRLLLSHPNPRANHHQVVSAWDRLNHNQKNFLDMKRGLKSARSTLEQHLFQNLGTVERATLLYGFGEHVAECWTASAASVKNELVTRGQGDLQHGIRLIRSEV